MRVTWRKEELFGNAQEIVKQLAKISWDDTNNLFKYMKRVARRCRQVHGTILNVKDYDEFLDGLAAVKEIAIDREEKVTKCAE